MEQQRELSGLTSDSRTLHLLRTPDPETWKARSGYRLCARMDDLGGVSRHHLADFLWVQAAGARPKIGQLLEIVDVQVWCHRTEHHDWLFARIGERVRGARWCSN